MADTQLWTFFHELREAVASGNAGTAPQPYRTGNFMVLAEADDTELTIRDVSEEDAVLIASELHELGARSVVRGMVACESCGRRVPDQAYCVSCRARLEPA